MGGLTVELPADETRDVDRTSAPADILTAWRAAERRYAMATPGTEEAAEHHLEMRRLMDEYEWRVRGSVPRPSARWPYRR